MLKSLRLTNFKSFAEDAAAIPFAPVTILVGANGSGKSNVFDAFRFLQGIGMGLSVGEILTGKWEGGREVFPALRGGSEEVCWSETDAFSVATESTMNVGITGTRPPDSAPKLHNERCLVEHVIQCVPRLEPRIEYESLDSLEGFSFRDDSKTTTIPFEPSQSFVYESFQALQNKNLKNTANDRHRTVFASVPIIHYRRVRFLDVRPSLMKGYVPLAVPELGEYAENLSAVVWRICQDEDQKEQYLQWLAALCAPEIEDITFIKTEAGDVMVQVVEADGTKKPITARSISDGTLRFMGILAAMFSAPKGSLFLMEEIETGLHPTRVHLLVELLEQFAESRKLQIIATTHSSQVLLGLSDKALRDVVLFARNEESPGTLTRRLGDLADFEEVTEKTQIDRLFTTGWLEQAL